MNFYILTCFLPFLLHPVMVVLPLKLGSCWRQTGFSTWDPQNYVSWVATHFFQLYHERSWVFWPLQKMFLLPLPENIAHCYLTLRRGCAFPSGVPHCPLQPNLSLFHSCGMLESPLWQTELGLTFSHRFISTQFSSLQVCFRPWPKQMEVGWVCQLPWICIPYQGLDCLFSHAQISKSPPWSLPLLMYSCSCMDVCKWLFKKGNEKGKMSYITMVLNLTPKLYLIHLCPLLNFTFLILADAVLIDEHICLQIWNVSELFIDHIVKVTDDYWCLYLCKLFK